MLKNPINVVIGRRGTETKLATGERKDICQKLTRIIGRVSAMAEKVATSDSRNPHFFGIQKKNFEKKVEVCNIPKTAKKER